MKHKPSVFSLSILGFFLTIIFFAPAYAKDNIVLNTTASPPLSTPEGTGINDMRLFEIFKRANIGLEIEYLPAERALINANEGINDGTFLRIPGLSRSYPNLIQVPEVFMDYEFVAISKNQKFRVDGWESLRPYNLGIITGWKIVEDNTGNAKTVTKAENVEQLFQLLKLNRVDIIIFEKLRGLIALQKYQIEGAVILQPPVIRKPMFMYMNIKHKNLIPKISDALRASKADGTHERLQREALKPFMLPTY